MSEPAKKRRTRCGQCGPCQIKSDCGQCKHCLNKAVLKQSCIYRKCVYLRGKPNPNSDFLRPRNSSYRDNGRSSSRDGLSSNDFVASPPTVHSDDSHQGSDTIEAQQAHQTSPYASSCSESQSHYVADVKSPYNTSEGFVSPSIYQQSGASSRQPMTPSPQAPHGMRSPSWHYYNNTNYIRNFVSPTFPNHGSRFHTPNFSWEWQLSNLSQKQDYFNFNFHRDNARDQVRNFLLTKPGQLYPTANLQAPTGMSYQVPHVRDPLIGGNLPPEPPQAANGIHSPLGEGLDRHYMPPGAQQEGLTNISLDDSMIHAYVNSNGINTIEINTGASPRAQNPQQREYFTPEKRSCDGSYSSTTSSPNYQELTDVSADTLARTPSVIITSQDPECDGDSINKTSNVILKQDLGGDQGEIQINIPSSGITIENIYDDEYSKLSNNTWDIFKFNDGFSSQIL